MSLVYKRPDSPYWYVTRTRESTGATNKKLAEEYARKALVDVWRTDKLGESAPRTWDELVKVWLDAKSGKRSIDRDRYILGDISGFLARRDISALGGVSADVAREYGALVKARASASTANRHLAALRAVLRYAARLGWIKAVPTIDLYAVETREARWLTREEFARFHEALPPTIRPVARMLVTTGLRLSNVIKLNWDWVAEDDSQLIVPAVSAKTKRTYVVPLSASARDVIAVQRVARTIGIPWVFPDSDGKSTIAYSTVRAAWDLAERTTGIACRRHDLRHTWASWHTQAGTPDRVLQELGGWASPTMLQRYGHHSKAYLSKFADNVE